MESGNKQERMQICAGSAARGIDWFKWIAILSAVNTGLFLFKTNTFFIFGLGITQVVNALSSVFSETYGSSIMYIGLIINLLISLLYYFFYKRAMKLNRVPFMIGIILYAVDALLFVVVQDYMSLLFHTYVLYRFIKGFIDLSEYKKLLAEEPVEVLLAEEISE